MALDPETEQRIEEPVSAEAVRETRLSPAEAVRGMQITLPVRGNRKLRKVLDRSRAPAADVDRDLLEDGGRSLPPAVGDGVRQL